MTDALEESKPKLTDRQIAEAQRDFTDALPVIDRVLRSRFTYIRGERKEEALAEGRAIAWANYLQVVRDGRDPAPLVKMMAKFAGLAVRSAARLTGQNSVNDVMSPAARYRHGHVVQSISGDDDEPQHPEVLAALADHREDSPADEAVARADFLAWLDTLDERHRAAAEGFAAGLDNTAVGEMVGAGRGTGSNLRCALRRSWEERGR